MGDAPRKNWKKEGIAEPLENAGVSTALAPRKSGSSGQFEPASRDIERENLSPSGGCNPGALNSAADHNLMMATDVVGTMKTSGSKAGQRQADKLSSAPSSRSRANALISRARRGSKSSLGSLLEQ